MFKEVISFLQSIWQPIQSVLQFKIIRGEAVSIKLSGLLLGLIVLFTGWKIIRSFVKKIDRYMLERHAGDEDAGKWLGNITSLVLLINLCVVSLIIIGIPASIIGKIHHFSLFSIKDSPIELGNVVLGIFLLYFGLKLSRYITKELQKTFLTRLNFDPAAQNTFSVILHYILIAVVLLFALSMVGIPLTAFTVIGGAVAIGFGLGSQNLVNNFLSGLVLMIERPLKVGDIVEVENRRGVVEHIGGRSTRILTTDNLRQVIPNSKLLENTVINYSLIDNFLRREIFVGVAYGSPVRKVKEILIKILADFKEVESDPKPLVLFSDFGDSALIFRILFMVKIARFSDILELESELRFMIDEKFNKEGIVIAFPQRDVHLDASRPIQVNVTRKEEDAGGD